MSYEFLNLERDDQVAVITLNRPQTLNSLNKGLQEDINAASEEIFNDDSVRAVILTGAGRGFCSGADLSGRGGARGEQSGPLPQNSRLDQMGWVGRLAMSVYEIGVPSIAAMNGVAAGAGMSIALGCDMRVGSVNSRFKTVFAERALSPDSGMSFFLPRLIGYGRAADLIFTNRGIDGEEAYRLGLLDRLVEPDEVLTTAMEVARQVASLPPMAIRAGKRVLQQNMSLDFHDALRNETVGLGYAGRAPNDRVEQAAAFMEKRPGKFTGT
tara:strand:+ start:13576 stop:14382 length:807 start_codon:yes stop_codon:yes gene_type:complete